MSTEDAARKKLRSALDTLGDAMDERPLPKDKVKSALDSLEDTMADTFRILEGDVQSVAILKESRDEVKRATAALKQGGRRRKTKSSKRRARKTRRNY
jgi:hypothetical protein